MNYTCISSPAEECEDYTTNQLVIKNESPFELVYKLETVIRGDRGPPPFTLTPNTATVAETHLTSGQKKVSGVLLIIFDVMWSISLGIFQLRPTAR